MTKGRKRNRKKSFWVSDSEWNAIERIAAETGMGIGEYLRISALGKTVYQIEELKPVLHELKSIGRNLNQLTLLAHQGVIRTVNLTATADGIGRCYAETCQRLRRICFGIPWRSAPAGNRSGIAGKGKNRAVSISVETARSTIGKNDVAGAKLLVL